MKKNLIRGLIVLAVLAVIVIVAMTLFLDHAIKKGVETIGPQLTRVSIKLDGVSISVLSGSGSVKGLIVGNPEGFKTAQAISVGYASLGLKPGSLLSDKVVIKHLALKSPEITFEGGIAENNLSKILENLEAAAGGASQSPPASKEADGPGKKLQVDDFLIQDAKVHVSLTGMGGKSVTLTIPDIHLQKLGEGPEGITAAALIKLVLNAVLSEASKAAASDQVKNLTQGTTDAVKDAGKAASDAARNVKDLFKKKE